MEKRIVVAIVVAIIIALLLLNSYSLMHVDDGEEPDLAQVTFLTNDTQTFSVTCDIADEPEERREGLMYRESLGDEEGMIFVYDTPQNMSFWMKNTLIPLDIIFIDTNLTVINIEEADVEPPETQDNEFPLYRSAAPAKWVVEINQGLSAEKGISPGTHVDIVTP
jgi:uncharacterized membrane protein (UPF0127 family)